MYSTYDIIFFLLCWYCSLSGNIPLQIHVQQSSFFATNVRGFCSSSNCTYKYKYNKCTPFRISPILGIYTNVKICMLETITTFWLFGRRIRVQNSIKFATKCKKWNVLIQIPMVNSWCLRCIKYTYLIYISPSQRNSLFPWSFNLKCFRWLFFSHLVLFFLSFVLAVPFDSNKFF